MTAIDTNCPPVRTKPRWTKPCVVRIDGRSAKDAPTSVRSDGSISMGS